MVLSTIDLAGPLASEWKLGSWKAVPSKGSIPDEPLLLTRLARLAASTNQDPVVSRLHARKQTTLGPIWFSLTKGLFEACADHHSTLGLHP